MRPSGTSIRGLGNAGIARPEALLDMRLEKVLPSGGRPPEGGDRLILSATPEAKPEPKPEPETTLSDLKPTPPAARPKAPGVLAQEASLAKALAGEAVRFPLLDGETLSLEIDRKGVKPPGEGRDRFRLSVDSVSFEVEVAAGLEAKEHLARALEYLAQVPPHLRPLLKSLTLENVANPQDAYWSEVFGDPSFSSAATAGGGAVTFWNLDENPYNLSEGTFHHELAHLIGSAYATSKTRHAEMVPTDWDQAMQADGKRVSAYAEHNPNEDFAESWRFYMLARRSPEALEAFREKTPNRSRVLEAIHANRREGMTLR